MSLCIVDLGGISCQNIGNIIASYRENGWTVIQDSVFNIFAFRSQAIDE